MRKFLNTLYVLNKDAYLSLEGRTSSCSATRLKLAESHSTGWKASSASAIPAQALP